jgi:hypothetical protein
LVLLAACDQQAAEPQALLPGDMRTFLTAELASQLTPEGRLPLTGPEPEPYPQITRERAAELAIAWARTYGRYFRPYLERDHARSIDFNALEVVSPVWYAASVYEPVPPEAHPAYRHAFGPHYLLYLGKGDEPVLGVSVAAFARSSIDPSGTLVDPPDSGNEVIAYGVPPGWGFSLPVSAEQAVRIAAEASGARVAEAPQMMNPDRDHHPYWARWKVSLDRAVTVRPRSGAPARATRELYVGRRGVVELPLVVQQDVSDRFPLQAGGSFSLRRRADRPLLFEPVNLGTR